MGAETFAFKSEARQLLDLMIHSLYSNKEIFLRELISNASDAVDKLRFEALTQTDLIPEGTTLRVRVHADAEARTVSVEDTGIGMSRDEVIENLGTIARSGTKEFAARMSEARKAGGADAESLIGPANAADTPDPLPELELVSRRKPSRVFDQLRLSESCRSVPMILPRSSEAIPISLSVHD